MQAPTLVEISPERESKSVLEACSKHVSHEKPLVRSMRASEQPC
jgi:hypothetical protein